MHVCNEALPESGSVNFNDACAEFASHSLKRCLISASIELVEIKEVEIEVVVVVVVVVAAAAAAAVAVTVAVTAAVGGQQQ